MVKVGTAAEQAENSAISSPCFPATFIEFIMKERLPFFFEFAAAMTIEDGLSGQPRRVSVRLWRSGL